MNYSLILNLTRQDFTDRYAGSIFGVLWAFLHPLALISIYLVVFSQIMGSRLPGVSNVENFSVYLVCGLLPWIAFANTIIRITSVFQDKKHIISKIKLNLSAFPSYVVISETITFVISFSIFLLYFIFFLNFEINVVQIFCLTVLFFLQQLLAFSLGLIFSIFNVFFRDTKEFATIFVNFWFWLTPIVWVPSIAPQWLIQFQNSFNPAFWFISGYRQLFVYSKTFEIADLYSLIIFAFVMLLFSLMGLRFLERDIRDFM